MEFYKLKNAVILGAKRHEVGEVVEMDEKQAKRFGPEVAVKTKERPKEKDGESDKGKKSKEKK